MKGPPAARPSFAVRGPKPAQGEFTTRRARGSRPRERARTRRRSGFGGARRGTRAHAPTSRQRRATSRLERFEERGGGAALPRRTGTTRCGPWPAFHVAAPRSDRSKGPQRAARSNDGGPQRAQGGTQRCARGGSRRVRLPATRRRGRALREGTPGTGRAHRRGPDRAARRRPEVHRRVPKVHRKFPDVHRRKFPEGTFFGPNSALRRGSGANALAVSAVPAPRRSAPPAKVHRKFPAGSPIRRIPGMGTCAATALGAV